MDIFGMSGWIRVKTEDLDGLVLQSSVKIQSMPSCCGMILFHGMSSSVDGLGKVTDDPFARWWDITEKRVELFDLHYRTLYDKLKHIMGKYRYTQCVMTDHHSRPQGYPDIRKFAQWLNLYQGPQSMNPKSGRQISTWVLLAEWNDRYGEPAFRTSREGS